MDNLYNAGGDLPEEGPVCEVQAGQHCGRLLLHEGTGVLIEEVGRGAYGRVYLATPKDSNGLLRAVKMISKARIKFPITFFNEIEILMKLDHPNIIKIYETYEDDDNYFVVTEYP